MLDDAKNLPDEPALLKGLIASMASELTSRDADLKSRDIRIEKPKHRKRMTTAQIAEAQRLAREWAARFEKRKGEQ